MRVSIEVLADKIKARSERLLRYRKPEVSIEVVVFGTEEGYLASTQPFRTDKGGMDMIYVIGIGPGDPSYGLLGQEAHFRKRLTAFWAVERHLEILPPAYR